MLRSSKKGSALEQNKVSLFLRLAEETLVKERGDNGDDRDDDESGDTIELLELRQIVEEELQKDHAKQDKTGIACAAGAFANSDDQQEQGEERPGNAVSHVTRKVAAELKCELVGPGLGEIIGDLNVQQNEGENDSAGIEQWRSILAQYQITRRRQQSRCDDEGDGNDSIGVKVPVKDGRGCARV